MGESSPCERAMGMRVNNQKKSDGVRVHHDRKSDVGES